jgi:hypothetical protein
MAFSAFFLAQIFLTRKKKRKFVFFFDLFKKYFLSLNLKF